MMHPGPYWLAAWPAQPSIVWPLPGCLASLAAWPAEPSAVWLHGQGSPARELAAGLKSKMVTCLESDILKISPTLKYTQKAGFET